MSFEFSRYPRKINLGCGFDKRDGFLNIDINAFHHPDLVCDVTNLQILPSSYYKYAIANDILEHIPRLKTRNVLREWNRILLIDGRLELRVPNVSGLLSLLRKKRNRTPAMHDKLLQRLFGTQSYHGDFHYTAFTDVLIIDMLHEAGFVVESMGIKEEWLFEVLARKVADRHVDSIFFLSDEEFLFATYKKLLGREPDPEGYEYYLNSIRSGIVREAVIEAIRNSDEYRLASSKKKEEEQIDLV